MENIWAFFYQTLTVSLTAAILLIVKRALRDKLSPHWQYGVWAVLALRVLIPADPARGLIPALGVWVEAAKSAAELGLGSALSSPVEPIDIAFPLPWIGAVPRSLTDWLFVLYVAGVAFVLVRYAVQYVRLRSLLRSGAAADGETASVIASVSERYGLTPCPAVAVPGLKTAFVCGVFRPILAVPDGGAPDEKVILHELLHLKYHDAAQGVFWCLLRALHWCNPFLLYVFDRVGNDMESLCDQRVLERLEGEERREYGSILLNMADRAYARAPGTSSISNGAGNIARRIEAIARFKLYPAGMKLVSFCAVLMLGALLLTGARASDISAWSHPQSGTEAAASLSAARIIRCTTIGGALDAYAAGVMEGNGVYLAMVSDAGTQAALLEEMSAHAEDGAPAWQVADPVGWTGAEAQYVSLRETGSGAWRCSIAIPAGDGYVLIPVEVTASAGAYLVRECGGRETLASTALDPMSGDLPPAYIASGESGYGTVTGYIYTISTVEGGGQAVDPYAPLTLESRISHVELDCTGLREMEPTPLSVGIACTWVEEAGGEPDHPLPDDVSRGGGYASSEGEACISADWSSLGTDYPVETQYVCYPSFLEDDSLDYPGGLAVRVYINCEPVADMDLETEAAP